MSEGAFDLAPPGYQHTQRGRFVAGIIATSVIASFVIAGTQMAAAGASRWAWMVLALTEIVVLGLGMLFSTLTVNVDAEAMRWHFARGAFPHTVPRADIARVEATTTRLLDGMGIHRGPRGWVYNVALGPAVRIVRRDGRAVLLGTDDPAGLSAALIALVNAPPTAPPSSSPLAVVPSIARDLPAGGMGPARAR